MPHVDSGVSEGITRFSPQSAVFPSWERWKNQVPEMPSTKVVAVFILFTFGKWRCNNLGIEGAVDFDRPGIQLSIGRIVPGNGHLF